MSFTFFFYPTFLLRCTCISKLLKTCFLSHNRYNPYLQTKNRVDQLRQLGHSVDKVESSHMKSAEFSDFRTTPCHCHTHAPDQYSCLFSESGYPLPSPPPTADVIYEWNPRWSSSWWVAPSWPCRTSTRTTSSGTSTTPYPDTPPTTSTRQSGFGDVSICNWHISSEKSFCEKMYVSPKKTRGILDWVVFLISRPEGCAKRFFNVPLTSSWNFTQAIERNFQNIWKNLLNKLSPKTAFCRKGYEVFIMFHVFPSLKIFRKESNQVHRNHHRDTPRLLPQEAPRADAVLRLHEARNRSAGQSVLIGTSLKFWLRDQSFPFMFGRLL